jgi:hypothetical protein
VLVVRFLLLFVQELIINLFDYVFLGSREVNFCLEIYARSIGRVRLGETTRGWVRFKEAWGEM